MLVYTKGLLKDDLGLHVNGRLQHQGETSVGAGGFDRLTAYWHSLQAQADGGVPLRSQFNPSHIVQLLPFVFMMERERPDVIRVRLCGTALDEISGTSITGHNYLDVCPPEDRQLYQGMMHQVLAFPCAVRLSRDITFTNRRTYSLTSLSYPLCGKDGLPRFTIGIMLPSRVLQSSDLRNGPVLKSVLKKLDYIDIGFGVPAARSASTE